MAIGFEETLPRTRAALIRKPKGACLNWTRALTGIRERFDAEEGDVFHAPPVPLDLGHPS